MFTPQNVLLIVGIVSIVVAVVMAILAAVYYTRNDIKSVMDDLSGRTRRNAGVGETTRRRRQRTRGNISSQRNATDDAVVQMAVGAVTAPSEDDLETLLDSKLQPGVQETYEVNNDSYDVNDDMPTVAMTVSEYHQNNVTQTSMEDADSPTVLDGVETEGASVFVVTRSIIAIHSNEIIAAG